MWLFYNNHKSVFSVNGESVKSVAQNLELNCLEDVIKSKASKK